jgi:hypothetical protein
MSVQAHEESPVAWDVEGWVKAALRNWADGYDEIEVHGHRSEGGERWIELTVYGRPVATVLVVRA